MNQLSELAKNKTWPTLGGGSPAYAKEQREWIKSIVDELKMSLKSEVESLRKRCSVQDERIIVLERERVESSSTTNVTGEILYSSQVNKSTQKNIVDVVVAKVAEKQAREKNVIIFGVKKPEREERSGQENSEEAEAATDETLDLQLVKELFKHVGVDDKKIQRIHRLKSKGDKPPPIVVKLTTKVDRGEVLKSAPKLRNEGEGSKYNGIFISPDLTLSERLRGKELRDERDRLNKELREAKEGGETVDSRYVVRGDKVVKMKLKI